MPTMFQIIYQGKYGDTVSSDNPLYDAMTQTIYLTHKCHITAHYQKNDDGSVTVFGTMLAPITFEPERSDINGTSE